MFPILKNLLILAIVVRGMSVLGAVHRPSSLAEASRLALVPGDRVEFPADSLVYGTWTIDVGGEEGRPITIATAPGGKPATLSNPNFKDDFGRVLDIRASHVVVENLSFADGATPVPDRTADPNYLGEMHRLVPLMAAVHVEKGATHVVVRNCEFTGCPVGIRLRGSDCTVVSNRLHGAGKITERWGAIAVAMTGSRLELAYNEIWDYGFFGGVAAADGAAFEIDGEDPTCARSVGDVNIHHNRARNVKGGFIEVTRADVRNIRLADNFSDCQDKFAGFWQLADGVTVTGNEIWHRREPLRDLFWGAVTNAVFAGNVVRFAEGTHFDRDEKGHRRRGYGLDFVRSNNHYISTARDARDFFRGKPLAPGETYRREDACSLRQAVGEIPKREINAWVR